MMPADAISNNCHPSFATDYNPIPNSFPNLSP